jgi:hypothetical protein
VVKFVEVASEAPMLISEVGNASLSPILSMSSDLLTPTLSNNPLLISQLTKHPPCVGALHWH